MRSCRKKDVLVANVRFLLKLGPVWLVGVTSDELRNIKMMRWWMIIAFELSLTRLCIGRERGVMSTRHLKPVE
jgi:hypothetical protein